MDFGAQSLRRKVESKGTSVKIRRDGRNDLVQPSWVTDEEIIGDDMTCLRLQIFLWEGVLSFKYISLFLPTPPQ